MASSTAYTPIIGMEIHVELKTSSKMFCGCRNDPFHAEKPNTYTCPVCLGLPGALPVPNKKAIEWTVMLGLALGCSINKRSRFDRKHYFYPDLAKGYQISQYDQPFCHDGLVSLASGSLVGTRDDTIRIRRVHLEEDTGKLLHRDINGKKVALIDFNRSGVPLVEIVTEPDMRSAEEAKEYAKKIHQIVRSLGISDADMEKGSMRLEANISLLQLEARSSKQEVKTTCLVPHATSLPNYKVEIKNINSFRFLERAINQEIERQEKLLRDGKKIKQETWGWDSREMTTKLQRSKEEAADYRYFPEPDIPPIQFTESEISNIKLQIPKLPEVVCAELVKLGASEDAAKTISSDRVLVNVALKITDYHLPITNYRNFTHWLLHHRELAQKQSAEELLHLFEHEKSSIVGDESQLNEWVDEAIKNTPQAVADFRAGKQQSLGFLIGQVQKLAKGKADAKAVAKIIVEKLSKA